MIPAVRRAVDVSIAGLLIARVATMPVVASAEAAPTVAAVMVHDVSPGTGFSAAGVDTQSGDQLAAVSAADSRTSGEILHTVREGETWGSISRTHFGTDELAERLLQANVGRLQADGSHITRHGVIYAGQTIEIPLTMGGFEAADASRSVTVEPGDTLWGIAARDLGDGERWHDIYSLSEGAVAPDGHILRNPNLIWPGLVVQEPVDPLAGESPDASTVEDAGSHGTQVPAVATAPTTIPIVAVAGATASAESPTPIAVATATPPPSDSDASVVALPQPTISPTEVPVPDVAGDSAPQPQRPGVSPIMGAAAGGAAGLAAIGAAGLILRRRHPRRLRTQSESDDEVRAGFAEMEPVEHVWQDPSRDDLDLALAIAARFSDALAAVLRDEAPDTLAELQTSSAAIGGIRHGRSSTTLMLQAVPMACRTRLIAALPEAATRAFGEKSDVEGMVSRDADVLVRLSAVVEELHTPALAVVGTERGVWPEPSLLLRLGLLADGQVFAANWDAFGHLLVAAPLGQGAEAILGGLVAGLVAKRPPTRLGLMVIGSPRSLPDELLSVPHLLHGLVDPHDEAGALEALESMRSELERRMSANLMDEPDMVLVLTELGQLGSEHIAVLGSIMVQGPRYRLRVLAASTRRPTELAQHCPVLSEFGTRLVLRTPDEEESLALIGSEDATELGSGGHLLARLEGRVPLEAHGYRAAPDRLARLVAAIHKNAMTVDGWRPPDDNEIPEAAPNDSVVADSGIAQGPLLDLASADTPDEQPNAGAERGEELPDIQAEIAEAPQDTTDQNEGPQPRDLELAQEGPDVELLHVANHHQFELPGTSGDRGDVAHSELAPEPSSGVRAPDIQHRQNGRDVAPPARPRLRGRFLGARELVYDGEVVWPIAGEPDESAMELLVFLAVNDPAGVRSEMLADSLWEADEDDSRSERVKKKRYRFRLALKRLVPALRGDPLAKVDKQNPVHRLNPAVIESDVHRFVKLVEQAKVLPREEAIVMYEEALELYRGDLLDRSDVPPYRWLDDGPRVRDLGVKYATMRQQVRRRLADLLATGTDDQLARAQELYTLLAEDDPLDHRVWEALARLHGRRNDLLGLEATMRRLRGALVELGEGEDPERVTVPPALAQVFNDVRSSLLGGRAA